LLSDAGLACPRRRSESQENLQEAVEILFRPLVAYRPIRLNPGWARGERGVLKSGLLTPSVNANGLPTFDLAVDIFVALSDERREFVGLRERRIEDLLSARDEPAPEVVESIVGAATSDHVGRTPQGPCVRRVKVRVEDVLEFDYVFCGQLV
jgi:hypothetical protein